MKKLLAGIVIGVVALVAIRTAFVQPPQPPHFHANFAIFINGERFDLSGDRYMEEIASCGLQGATVAPRTRAHLHNRNPDVAHVHQPGVTWGALLANLGFGVGDNYLATPDGRILVSGNGGGTLKFMLNGTSQQSIYNTLIGSRDRLLISYGAESIADVTRSQLPVVASNADEFNRRKDPASCGGSRAPTFRDRVEHALAG